MSTKNSKIDIISIDSVISRPKTRSELLNKLKEGVKCEVLESNKETTSIMLDGWLIFRGKYKIYPSENIGWVIYEIVNKNKIIREDIWEFAYTYCIHDSAMATISLHRTKKGAETAMYLHKEQERKKWKLVYPTKKEQKENPFERHIAWKVCKRERQFVEFGGIGTKDRRGIDKETSENLKEMSNEALIGFAEDQITELARTGGRSHKMCVPPSITDTDMLFSELIRRFKKALAN